MDRINDEGVGISILFAAFCLISPFHEPPTEILCVSHVDGGKSLHIQKTQEMIVPRKWGP